MKHLQKIILSFLFILGCVPFLSAAPKDDIFQINDQDISALGLSEAETQEFKQFIEAINNLPSEDKEFLQQVGKEMEEKMREEGRDPNNFEDVQKWMEKQNAALVPEQSKPAPTVKEEPKVAPQPTLVQVASPTDAVTLLKEIFRHLDSLHNKASKQPVLAHKLGRHASEFIELKYWMSVLQDKDLLPYLTSKDFEKLYNNLEKLHNTLATYEPTIVGKAPTFDEDDPYEILGVPYKASIDEIDLAYEALKAEKHPDAIARKLDAEDAMHIPTTHDKEPSAQTKKQKVDSPTTESTLSEGRKKARREKLKEARLTFSFIQNAYDTLKDSKQRAQVDRELHAKIGQAKAFEESSNIAFNKILDALTMALYPHNVLGTIRQIIEKHKPQQLAQAKQQTELEKKVYERSKQVTKIAQVSRPIVREPSYDSFYQHMAQESYRPPYSPRPYNGFTQPQQRPNGTETPSQANGTKAKGAVDKKKESKDKDKKDKEKKAKEKAPSNGSVAEKDIDKARLIGDIEEILKNSSNTIELAQVPTRGLALDTEDNTKEQKEKAETIEFKDILTEVNDQLIKPVTRSLTDREKEKEAFTHLQAFFEKNKLKQLHDKLKDLAPGPQKKIDNPTLASMWKERIQDKYQKQITEWHDKFNTLFNPKERHNKGQKRINKDRYTRYGLHVPEKKLWEKKDKNRDKDKGKKQPKDKRKKEIKEKVYIPLNEYRDYIKGIHTYFKNISEAFAESAQDTPRPEPEQKEPSEKNVPPKEE